MQSQDRRPTGPVPLGDQNSHGLIHTLRRAPEQEFWSSLTPQRPCLSLHWHQAYLVCSMRAPEVGWVAPLVEGSTEDPVGFWWERVGCCPVLCHVSPVET